MSKKKLVPRIQLDKVGKPVEVIARIAALEAEEVKRNPEFRVPDTKPVTK